MWKRSDSKRFIPTDIGRRFRASSFHDPEHDRAQRRPTRQQLHFDGYGQSQIGRTRRINQDQFFTMPLGADASGVNCFLGVADGIGGAPGGEDASFLAVETLTRFVREESERLLRPDGNDGEIVQTLTRGLKRCHAELQEIVQHHPEFSGMGTTLTAALVRWPHLYLVHLGDARAYLLRDGALRRLTHDHTYAQALLEAGVLNETTVKTSAMRNVLSNYLSGDLPEKDPEVHPEVRVDLLHEGDTLLFCTDGLTHVLSDERLRELLASGGSPRELCGTLIEQARDLQARDDATALIARFEGAAPRTTPRRQGKDSEA
jgi:protein phosphatase